MSQENVDLVKGVVPDGGVDMVRVFRGSSASAPGTSGIDVTAFASEFEVEFIAARASIRPASSGPEGLFAAWRDWLEPWESYYLEVEEVIDAGDEVVSLVRVHARTTRDAVAVDHLAAAVWTMREKKIVGLRFYLERETALEAVGLG